MSNNREVTISESRLDRIEDKIDDLVKAFAVLARTEEKQLTLERDRLESNARILDIDKKIVLITKQVEDNNRTVQFINKLFWVVITALVGVYILQFISV